MCNYDDYRADGCCTCRSNCCLWIVSAIIGALFLFTLGLILGTVFAETFFPALSALIVLAVALFVMAIAFAIVAICKRCY